MQPSRILSILALGVFSLVPPSLASKNNGDRDKFPERKKIPKTRHQHQEQRTERAVFDENGKRLIMPTVTVADSDFYVSETSQARCIRESKSTNLDNRDPIKFMNITKAHREGKFPSKAYLKLHDEHPETDYFPLETEHLTPEDQNDHPNFMARIMTRYRKDMGLAPVLPHDAPDASPAEVLDFLQCFENVPSTIAQDEENLKKIIEAYSFLQYLGIIPQRPRIPEQCDEIKEKSRIMSFANILPIYNKRLTDFNLLQ